MLSTFAQIITDTVAAIKTAPSEGEAALAYSLFFWLPHIILPIVAMPEQTEKKFSEEEKLRAQGIRLKQTLIDFTSGNPSALFEQLVNPKVVPQFKPTQQTQGLDTNPNHPLLSGSQKKLFLKDFHAGCFGKAANNLFNTSPLKSYAVDNVDLKKKCEAFFSPFPEGSPSYLDAMRPGSTRWHMVPVS